MVVLGVFVDVVEEELEAVCGIEACLLAKPFGPEVQGERLVSNLAVTYWADFSPDELLFALLY